MANFRQFLAPSAHNNQALKFYLKDTQVGTGTILHVDEQRLFVRGAGGIPKLELRGEVEIIMDGPAPKGRCVVIARPEGRPPARNECEYVVTGNRLDIELPLLGWIGLQPEGQDITWIRTLFGTVWYSARPAGMAVPAEGFPEAPAGAEVDAGEPANAGD